MINICSVVNQVPNIIIFGFRIAELQSKNLQRSNNYYCGDIIFFYSAQDRSVSTLQRGHYDFYVRQCRQLPANRDLDGYDGPGPALFISIIDGRSKFRGSPPRIFYPSEDSICSSFFYSLFRWPVSFLSCFLFFFFLYFLLGFNEIS